MGTEKSFSLEELQAGPPDTLAADRTRAEAMTQQVWNTKNMVPEVEKGEEFVISTPGKIVPAVQ